MKMKRVLSCVLAAAMICSMLVFGTGAMTKEEETMDAAKYFMGDYLFFAEFCQGYFAEGSSPSAFAIDQYFKWVVELDYGEYMTEDDGYGFCKYEIPADVYEELVFSAFAENDAVRETLRASDIYKTDKAEPYYLIQTGGGFGGSLPYSVVQGYTERDDGCVTVYSYLVQDYIEDENYIMTDYVPSEDEVEGEDYVYICDIEDDYEAVFDGVGYKYVPAKIVGAVRSVMELNTEEWSAVYHSFETIDKSEVVAGDEIIVPEENTDIVCIGEAFIDLSRDAIGDGVALYGEWYYDDEERTDDEFDTTAELLKDYGETCGVYEFTARKNGENVQPKGKIPVSFLLPYDFSPESVVYYIAEDGTVSALETVIDPDSYDPTYLYATAELEHFSRYAVAGTRYGDTDKSGSVDLRDAVTMLKKIAKWDIEVNEKIADANRDGDINLTDVILILKYIAKWDVAFGADYKPAESEPTPVIPEIPGMEIDKNGVLVKYTGTDTEVIIPDGVTAIGDKAFERCAVTSVTIPGSVTSIGMNAFFLCERLENVNIPDGVAEIGESAFAYCPIKSVELPDSVTSVENFAFFRCPDIAEITLSKNLVSIGSDAFSGCYKKVDIPASLTSIGHCAFAGSEVLAEINVSEENPVYKSVNGVLFTKDGKTLIEYPKGKADTKYTVPSGVTKIEHTAFGYCKGLTSVILPRGLETIGSNAFIKCDGIYGITIPDTVTEMGVGVFMDCKNLIAVTLSNSLTVIPNSAFSYCRELTDVEIPNSVTTIKVSAFSQCTSLRNVIIPAGVTTIEEGAFDGFGACPNLKFLCSEGSAADEYSIKHKITCNPNYFS